MMDVVGGGVVRGLSRTVGRAAEATTAAAGAVGGAVVDGVAGGVKGAVAGVQRGISNGSHSTPAAALTMGALGVAGLVEWPVLLAVGGAALLLRRLNPHPAVAATNEAPVKPAKAQPRRAGQAKQTPKQRSNSDQAPNGG